MRFSKTLVVLLLCFIAIVSAVSVTRVTVGNVPTTPGLFVQTKIANPNESVHFKIMLKQKNLKQLEDKFWEVSTPKSAGYGKFMSAKEIDSIVAPSKSDVQVVVNWLLNNKISKKEMIVHSDFIQVRTNVGKASSLFETQFAHYESSISIDHRIRISGEASIPSSVHEKLDFVLGLTDFIQDNRMSESMRQSRSDVAASSVLITPDVIKSFYGVPAGQIGVNSENTQSIGAFTDFFAKGALEYFDKQYNIDASTVRVNVDGQDCLGQGCDQYESNLDVQYITAVGNNVSTLFLASGNGEWILDWATAIQAYNPIPKVASLSYGWAEIEQCEITSSCTTLGIDSSVYIQRTNVEIQKIGLRGTSVLVSAGDDGAPSFYGASGNCPIDTAHYCPLGGCAHTTTSCPSLTIAESNGTQCFFPMGSGSNDCQAMLQNQKIVDGINQFVRGNSKCKVSLEQDVQKNYHIYSSCACSALKPLSGDDFKIVGYSFDQTAGTVFQPDYPTSSPYVTSVGATQIVSTSQPEIVCSSETGAIITTGGGFAITQAQPSYQAAAVANYLKTASNLPPSFSFNAQSRAYPDITLVGHNYQIGVTSDATSDNCPCSIMSVDGTSCSSPTLAGMISLINDKLLIAGKPQLGFLNPLLYQAAIDQPNVFNDVTTGNNNCNRAYCCEYGFPASTGYDAASGLGSINFANLEKYILSL